MPKPLTFLLVLTYLCLAATTSAQSPDISPVRLTIENVPLNPVDDRIFGHFLERASWGEPGYDAVRDEHKPNELESSVVSLMHEMHIPIIRYPGGTDILYYHWMDMIDNVPGREGGRPLFERPEGNSDKSREYTNAFGLDEFLALCRELNTEPLLVTNFYQGAMQVMPLHKAALEAAGLVAYCNAPVGATLPEGMPNWPAVRAQNGHPEPYNLKTIQVANEVGFYYEKMMEKAGLQDASKEQKVAYYTHCLLAYLRAIRAVDPDIEIIIEGSMTDDPEMRRMILEDPEVKALAQYAAVHIYMPWGIKSVTRNGLPVDLESLTDSEAWQAWVATPYIDEETGLSVLKDGQWDQWSVVREAGWDIAVTEWNWNGWWHLENKPKKRLLDSMIARGVGAAGMLHAFMRQGDTIKIGCQSMLVGVSWGIRSINASEDDAFAAYPYPSGQVTALYSRFHGDRRLASTTRRLPTYHQPYLLESNVSLQTHKRVAWVDAVVTATDNTLFIHAINRDFNQSRSLQLDWSAITASPAESIVLHWLEGDPHVAPRDSGKRVPASIKHRWLEAPNKASATVTLPPHTVSIIEVQLPGLPVNQQQ